jgi:hypothetical protein
VIRVTRSRWLQEWGVVFLYGFWYSTPFLHPPENLAATRGKKVCLRFSSLHNWSCISILFVHAVCSPSSILCVLRRKADSAELIPDSLKPILSSHLGERSAARPSLAVYLLCPDPLGTHRHTAPRCASRCSYPRGCPTLSGCNSPLIGSAVRV